MAAESKLQTRVLKDLKSKGWIPFRCATEGWPDRGFLKSMEIFWIEFKAPGKRAKPLQLYTHEIMKRNGFTVYVIDSWDQYVQLKIE